ncbi:MAG: DUF2281 domain-containing protein [Methanophagales archaeon]|nr:DUF2281 domain-containing protein [Methanophagales archaeon]
MLEREYIVERIKSLPDESLKEVTDFIEFLEAKRKRLVEEEEKKKEEEDPLTKVIGICEGPSDLAERHNKYVYGIK